MKKSLFLFSCLATFAQAGLAEFDAAVAANVTGNEIQPTAQLTTPATFDGSRRQAFNFGNTSGSVTMEFIVSGSAPSSNNATLAVGSNTNWELRFSQHSGTEELGYTHFGTEDYRTGIPLPTEPTYVVYRWNRHQSVMDVYINGLMTASDYAPGFEMPTGNGFFGARNAAGTAAMTGRIDRVVVHNSAIDPAIIREHADAWLDITPDTNVLGQFPPEENLHPALFRHDASLPTNQQEDGGFVIGLDGKVAAIMRADFEEAGVTKGAVDIYVKRGSRWDLRQTFIGQGPTQNGFRSKWGRAMALRDGLLVIGQAGFGVAPLEVNLWGVIYFYTWNEEKGLFEERDGMVSTSDRMGSAIGISGTRVVAGAVEGDKVHYYDRDGNNFIRQQTINAPSGAVSFGNPSVRTPVQTISLDGDTLVVGAPGTNGGTGAVYTYTYENGQYGYDGTVLTPAAGDATDFGDAVVVRGDTLIVSSPRENNQTGKVYVYRKTEAGWTAETELVPNGARPQIDNGGAIDPGSTIGAFGLALADDGETIFATSSVASSDAGSRIYTWKRSEGGAWLEDASITEVFTEPPFPDLSDEIPADGFFFGISIALSGDRLLGGSLLGKVNVFETDYSNAPHLANELRAQLFTESPHPLFDSERAAFRYRNLLFEKNDSDQLVRVETPVSDHFGVEEQARLDAVNAELKTRIGQAPFSVVYGDLYLDVIYERASLQILEAQDELIDLDISRLEGLGGIDDEIALFNSNLDLLRDSLVTLLEPLDERFEINNSGVPYGFQFYENLVPARSLMAAQYDDEGVLKPLLDASGNPITGSLVGGYKDALLFFEVLGEYGCSSAALADLHLKKGESELAEGVLQDARELLFIQGSIIRGVFRDSNGDDPAELEEALAAWEQGISDLRQVEDAIGNGLNPLGYDDDFLILLQRADGDDDSIFNTFNILSDGIRSDTSTLNFLKRAKDDRTTALTAYDNYQGGLDQLALGLDAVRGDSGDRLSQLVGEDYGTAAYEAVPGPNTGLNGGFVPGSALWDQYQNIRRARVQIQKNAAEIANLEEKVRIEADRNLFEVQTQNAISQVRVNYANQRASMEEEISRLNAAQKYTEVLADSFNPANWGQVIGNAINAGTQVYGELRKGEIAAERERMAAQEEAEITALNNEVLNKNSAALIETWLLDMKTLVLSSQESAIILQQEMGRLLGLMRERETLERRIEAHAENIENRYFADPVHRLRFLKELLVANRSFVEAQRTVFFMAKALEYKWNEPFRDFMGGSGITLNSIYSARNAEDLDEIVDAMNVADGTNDPLQDVTDVFSVRQDAFGYVDGEMYPDPQTGQMVNAVDAFRSLLEKDFLVGRPGIDANVRVVIPFSTVRDPLVNLGSQQTFFRGARDTIIESDGSIVPATSTSPKGSFLDKINQLAVTMPGTYSGPRTSAPCDLIYGGSGFLRTRSLGRYNVILQGNERRFDRLSEGLTAIPTRSLTFLNGRYVTRDQLTATPRLALDADPEESDYVNVFRERSVACNGWQIVVTLSEEGGASTIDYANTSEIDDILLHFRHKAIPRQ